MIDFGGVAASPAWAVPTGDMAGVMAGETILIVDDDSGLRDLLAEFLSGHGYQVRQAGDVPGLRRALADVMPDLIILDLMMPGEDGLSGLRQMDPATRPPVIMLSAMGSDADKIIGLELGADDYLMKPCNPRELLARVRAVLRRAGGQAQGSATLHFGGWQLDPETRELVSPRGLPVPLTGQELRLLECLVRAGRRVLSRDELALRMGGDEVDAFDRAIDLAVSRLRRKLAEHHPADVIRTVRGEGYGLAPQVSRK